MSIDLDDYIETTRKELKDDYIETTRKELEDEKLTLDELESDYIIFSNNISAFFHNGIYFWTKYRTINKIKIIFKEEYISHDKLRNITCMMKKTAFEGIIEVNLLDLILLYTNLKTTVKSNEVTILLPMCIFISISSDKIHSIISDIYGYNTINLIELPKYFLINSWYLHTSKIIIRILDETNVSVCSIKYLQNYTKKVLFEQILKFDSAVKNSKIPNCYLFDVSKNMVKDYELRTEKYKVVFYDDYENIIDSKYEISFYSQLS